MLPWIFHWHDASKQAPLPGEARLLWFANGNTPGGADDNEEDPDEKKNAPTNKFDEEIGKAADEFAQKMKEAFIKHHPSNQNPNTPSTPGTTTIDVDQAIPAEQPAASDQPAAPAVPTQPQDPNAVPGSTVIDADPSGVRETTPQETADADEEEAVTESQETGSREGNAQEEGEETALRTINIEEMLTTTRKIHDNALGQYERLKMWEEKAKNLMTSEQYATFQEMLESLYSISQMTDVWTIFLQDLKPWTEGEIAPQALIERLQLLDIHSATTEQEKKFKQRLHEAMDALTLENTNLIDTPWESMNKSDRYVIVDRISQETGLRELEEFMKTNLDNFDAFLFQQDPSKVKDGLLEQYTEEVDEHMRKADVKDIEEGGKKGLFTSLKEVTGIEFYTINQIISAWTQFKEGFQQTRNQKDRQKGAKLARQFGPFVKWFAPDIDEVLEMNSINKDNEVKNQYREYLNNNVPSFKEVFGQPGLLSSWQHDELRVRATLEYAASHGWLYGLSQEKGKAADQRQILGRSNWTLDKLLHSFGPDGQDKYYIYLLAENRKGEGAEASAALERESSNREPEAFIRAIDIELNNLNLWGAKGIVESAFKTGLAPTTSARLATTIMRHLRTNAELRKYVTVEWLNQVGNIAAYSPAPALGMLKFQQKEIAHWANSSSKEISSFQLGSLIQRIEDEIQEKNPAYFRKFELAMEEVAKGNATKENIAILHERDDLIAKILATQTVTLDNGQVITIFTNRYNDYNQGSKKQGTIKIEELDEDYFRDQSEIILSDKIVIAQILRTESKGTFIDKSRAGYFVLQVVQALKNLNDEIKEKPENKELLQARKNYQTTIREKLSEWIKTIIRQDTPATANEIIPSTGAYVIKTLIENDLIDLHVFQIQENRTTKAIMQTLSQTYQDKIKSLQEKTKPTVQQNPQTPSSTKTPAPGTQQAL